MTRLLESVDSERLSALRQQYNDLDQQRRSLWGATERDELKENRARREGLTEQMVEILRRFVEEELDPEDTKKNQILQLLPALERDVSSQHLAKAVECSVSHAQQFRWDDDRKVARKRDWAQREAENRASYGKSRSIKRRDDHQCRRCGRSGTTQEVHVHHIIPVGRGGTDDRDNLVTLCKPCHGKAHGGSISSSYTVYEGIDEFWGWIK